MVFQNLFSINRICYLCGLSKNTYYSHKHPNDRFTEKYVHLKTKIQKIISQDSFYGVGRIKTALLNNYQVSIGRDALGKLLKLWHLQLRRKIKRKRKSVIEKILISLAGRSNLLIRTKIQNPLQAISSDITEIMYNYGKSKAYLAVHKDVYGQAVYGWELGKNMESELVISSYKKSLCFIKGLAGKIPQKMIFHSDQGSQYTSYRYVDEVLKNKMILSYSTPGTPTENPGQESFFGRLKDELQAEISEIRNFKNLNKFFQRKIDYYNKKRLHTSLNNQAPLLFTKNFIKSLPLIPSPNWFSFLRG